MNTRRSFLKGLCAAAALTLARILPDLAPDAKGFRDLPDGWYYIRIRYGSIEDGKEFLSAPTPVYAPQQPLQFNPRNDAVWPYPARVTHRGDVATS